MPIRKVGADKVALTSYYGKLFIRRSPKATNSFSRWIIGKLSSAGLNGDDKTITDIKFGKHSIPAKAVPRTYSAIMESITSFKSNGNLFFFDYEARMKQFGEAEVTKAEKDGFLVCGKAGNMLIVIDDKNILHTFDGTAYHEQGSLMRLIGGDWGTVPVDVVEVAVYGKAIPVILAMSLFYGLDGVIRRYKIKHRRVPTGQRATAEEGELKVRFKDESVMFDMTDPKTALLVSGMKPLSKYLSYYNATDLNKEGGVVAVLNDMDVKSHVINELKLIRQMFVDPITKEILEDMGEPTTIPELFIRAVELLMNDQHPDETDPKYQRLRGIERFSGTMYATLVNSIRDHRSRPSQKITGLEMPHNEVWRRITTDATVQLVEEANPVHALKEQESVTLAGEGGRSARTLVQRSRVFHKNDLGVISESSPDSAKVGVKSYMSPNAKLSSIRGTMETYEEGDSASTVLSSTSLIMPAAHHDDSKRIMLAAVQNSAVVPAEGYQSLPARTGYEAVVGSRVGKRFAFIAQKKGVIDKVGKSIVIKYNDGKTDGVEIGRRHGIKAGDLIPFDMVTDLEVGDKVEEGDVVAWHSGFFERDLFSPKNVTMKVGILTKIAVWESTDTLEDSSPISSALAKKLRTPITKRKTIIVELDKEVEDLVKVGDEISYDTILCNLKESGLSKIEETDKSLDILSALAELSPKAKFSGTVSKIEVFYVGEVDEMTESLKSIIATDNKRRAGLRRDLGTSVAPTGKLSKKTNIAGELLLPNTVAISIFIDTTLDSGIADKSVLGNQLKTTHNRVFESGTSKTEEGDDIDMFMGARSIQARVVDSVFVSGALNTTLIALSKKMIEAYRGG